MARTNSPVTWAVILSQSQFRFTSMRPSWMRVYEAAGLVLSDPAGSLVVVASKILGRQLFASLIHTTGLARQSVGYRGPS